jgi:phosphatidylinositol dimannoside acyltransferase
MTRSPIASWFRRFDVRGVFWRQYLDWAVSNVPFYFVPVLIWLWTIFFFFFAAPARRAVLSNLAVIIPGANRLTNYARTWRTLYNFAWTITEASQFKLNKADFGYEIDGEGALARLAAAKSAIVLTAHMGNYDLGAALFAEKFQREIRMVRAPEPHRETARHLAESIEKTGAGGVRVDYTSDTAALSFALLQALRANEIVSIQGDRVVGDAVHATTELLGQPVSLPSGPFILAQIAEAPIFPLFIVRTRYRRYKVIVRQPIVCLRNGAARDEVVTAGLREWSAVLEEVIRHHWDQWFAFVPTFSRNASTHA